MTSKTTLSGTSVDVGIFDVAQCFSTLCTPLL
jgi:hypothetical protein